MTRFLPMRLASIPGQCVVDLVRAGVQEVFALQINFRPANCSVSRLQK